MMGLQFLDHPKRITETLFYMKKVINLSPSEGQKIYTLSGGVQDCEV
jgi:hypothetical protein